MTCRLVVPSSSSSSTIAMNGHISRTRRRRSEGCVAVGGIVGKDAPSPAGVARELRKARHGPSVGEPAAVRFRPLRQARDLLEAIGRGFPETVDLTMKRTNFPTGGAAGSLRGAKP